MQQPDIFDSGAGDHSIGHFNDHGMSSVPSGDRHSSTVSAYDPTRTREIVENPAWVQETTRRVAQLTEDVQRVLQFPLRHEAPQWEVPVPTLQSLSMQSLDHGVQSVQNSVPSSPVHPLIQFRSHDASFSVTYSMDHEHFVRQENPYLDPACPPVSAVHEQPQGEFYIFYDTKIPLPPAPRAVEGTCHYCLPSTSLPLTTQGHQSMTDSLPKQNVTDYYASKSPEIRRSYPLSCPLPDLVPSPEKARHELISEIAARASASFLPENTSQNSGCSGVIAYDQISDVSESSSWLDQAEAKPDGNSTPNSRLRSRASSTSTDAYDAYSDCKPETSRNIPQSLNNPEDRMTYPNMSVSDQGTLIVKMHPGITVEMTIDRAFRVTNHQNSSIACVNVRGSASCILHPGARVYHYSTSVEAQVEGHRSVRMKTGVMDFTRGHEGFTVVREAVQQKTLNLSIIDLNTANSVFGCSSSGPEFKEELCLCAAKSRLVLRDDDVTSLHVNGTKIKMRPNGDIEVTHWPKSIRMRYETGEVTVVTHFIRANITGFCDVKIDRGVSHFSTCGVRTVMVANEWILTGLDDRGQFFLTPAGMRHTLAPQLSHHQPVSHPSAQPLHQWNYLQLDDDESSDDDDDDVTSELTDVTTSISDVMDASFGEMSDVENVEASKSQNKFIIRDDSDSDGEDRLPLAVMTSVVTDYKDFPV